MCVCAHPHGSSFVPKKQKKITVNDEVIEDNLCMCVCVPVCVCVCVYVCVCVPTRKKFVPKEKTGD